ncbi:MAG: exo-beta-N-acetylmuramidase NamZ domain-containing protein [Fervidobacterium nodosum]
MPVVRVLNGIDVFDVKSFVGKKLGVVTNYSSVTKDLRLLIDIMFQSKLDVKAVYTPEHGLYGQADGDLIADSNHPKYGIKIVSLYGVRDIESDLDCSLFSDIDLLIYDIQDVGLRYYTFIYTLAQILKAASLCQKKVIVLDRFNPLGRFVFGPRIPKSLDSIVGAFELPVRYGLTTGELALYYKKYMNIDVEIEIVKCRGWNGQMLHETDSLWNVPSPNLPTYSSLLCYAGMCLFEATNVSVGRGTTKPFEYLGAPWIDSDDIYTFLKERFPNLRFRKRDFIPQYREYAHQVCHGLEFFPKPEDNFFEVAVALIDYLKNYKEFHVNERFIDKLSGVENFMKNKEVLLNSNYEEYFDFVDEILLYGPLNSLND